MQATLGHFLLAARMTAQGRTAMKVFMLGWEFPPYISGGLGTACYGLTRGLDEVGVEVAFVLPMALPHDAVSHVSFRTPSTLARYSSPAA